MYIRWLPVICTCNRLSGCWLLAVFSCLFAWQFSSVQFSSVMTTGNWDWCGLCRRSTGLLRCFVDVSTSYFYIYILNEFVSISHIPAALATRGRPERPGSANFAGPARKT